MQEDASYNSSRQQEGEPSGAEKAAATAATTAAQEPADNGSNDLHSDDAPAGDTQTLADLNEAAADAAPADASPAGEPFEPDGDALLQGLREQIKAQQREASNRETRLLADMENLRRRTEREKQEARTYGIASFAKDIVVVADNLERALESSGTAEAGASNRTDTVAGSAGGDETGEATAPNQALSSLVEGVELTLRSLNSCLERHGVVKIDPSGEKFDPNLHQAVFEVAESDIPKGYVALVMQPGYRIGDRVLRPAMVGVSSANANATHRDEN